MALNITAIASGYVASAEVGGGGPTHLSAATLAELVGLLSAAGYHSTDVSDALDAAGLDWPGDSE